MTYLFTFVAGTGHVAYSVLPVIAEVATETKIRPERPLGIAVIASQQAITASPISAATVALLGLLAGFDITLFDILKITIPATIVGVLVGALFSMKVGKELVEDPEYQKRLKEGLFNNKKIEIKDVKNKRSAMISVLIFILATAFIVLFGSFEGMRPSFLIDGEIVTLGMSSIIEIVMLSAAAIILLVTKTDGIKATQGSVFPAGMQAVIAIFGIAWMGDTFLQGNMGQLTLSIEGIVQQMPWLFGVALFVMSILLYSQAATVRALVPLGIALGISPYMLIALFPAVNGYFFIPNYPTVVAAINFDRTGTTKIGKYVLNHSFMTNTNTNIPYSSGMMVKSKILPVPKNSRTAPSKVRAMVKPSPIPIPSNIEATALFLAAKASARPSTIQFTTINGMKRPSVAYSPGT